jgi:hypothetical protein
MGEKAGPRPSSRSRPAPERQEALARSLKANDIIRAGARNLESAIYFGSTRGSPPGVPGGGMTLSAPPPGGLTCISRSRPAGGQITPLDCASLSLNGSLLPPPTVGASPSTSGGHAAPSPCSGTRSLLGDCAITALAVATLRKVATIRRMARKGFSHGMCNVNDPDVQNVPPLRVAAQPAATPAVNRVSALNADAGPSMRESSSALIFRRCCLIIEDGRHA